MSVKEASFRIEVLWNIKKSTLARSPTSVKHVEKALPELHTLFNIREATWGKRLHHSDLYHPCQSWYSLISELKALWSPY